MKHLKYKILLYIVAALLPAAVFASITNGTIDNTYKYAWGENIGWINFGADNGNVSVTDSAITGYAWSDNYGWINLSPSASGVVNDGEGNLSGYGWAENLGWINFSGVSIDTGGVFGGYAVIEQDSSQISFNCSNADSCSASDFKVKTDWRPRSVRPACNNALDDDSDGKVDYPADTGCSSLEDDNEINEGSVPLWLLSSSSWIEPAPEEDVEEDAQEEEQGEEEQEETVEQESIESEESIKSEEETEEESQIDQVIKKLKEILESAREKIIAPPKILISKLLPIADEFFNPEYFRIDLKKMPLAKIALEKLSAIMPDFLMPKSLKITPPRLALEKLVPLEAPFPLTGGWRLMPEKPIKIFVFAPLPDYLSNLAKKFPELEKTFNEVGINKMADIGKLQGAKFTLYGLTGDPGLQRVKIGSEYFYLPSGIPIARLSPELKQKMPSEIIFAKAGAELIDFGIDLTIDNKGRTQQKITTVSGKPIKLAVKPDGPVDAVKGYLVFKGKNSKFQISNNKQFPISNFQFPKQFIKPAFAEIDLESKFQISNFKLQNLLSSLFFAKPSFAYQQEQPIKAEEKFVLMEFDYNDADNDGIWTAEIQAPVVDGEYEIITVIYYTDPEFGARAIRLTTVVDPEGYIYEKYKGKEIRIPGAIASLYWLNPGTKKYQLWPSGQYNQENPQITGMSGNYSFLVPEGSYYLKVETPGYLDYQGKPFQVREGSGVHINIELKTKYWWIKLINWQTIILILVVILLFYNFYRDRIRNRKEQS